MTVERLLPEWPERGQRERQWFTPERAAEQVAEAELIDLLRALVSPASKS
ncbi:hypothetical protein MON41_17345 [Roseomonas vastitatis]|uniref:Uncharacterized protein n=1 Tax=Teichococcus vastitatis TaxID=2307076 RepID=A0ABS9W8D8_9PROT|nr:hypothetical protein [Pseudoroseomonas vastitatis]